MLYRPDATDSRPIRLGNLANSAVTSSPWDVLAVNVARIVFALCDGFLCITPRSTLTSDYAASFVIEFDIYPFEFTYAAQHF